MSKRRALLFFFVFCCLPVFAADASFAKEAPVKKSLDNPSLPQSKQVLLSASAKETCQCGPQCGPQYGPPRPENFGPTAPPPAGAPTGPPQPGSSRLSSGTIIETISPTDGGPNRGLYLKPQCPPQREGYTVNFQDISIIELIQFISQISGTNYIYDQRDLTYQGAPGGDVIKVTIVSQDPTSVEDLSSALVQILRMHNLYIVENGNNILIYRNQNLSKVSRVITDSNINDSCDATLVTRVFRLYNIDPERLRTIIQPLVSPGAIVEVSVETRHLIVSDITSNVDKIADLLTALDTPNAALDIAEYRVTSGYPMVLTAYAKDILAPLILDNPLQMVAQPSANKIFIVSTPYLIQKALQILRALDHPDVTEAIDLPAAINGTIETSNFFMFKLKYQNGAEIADALRNIGVNLEFAGAVNPDFLSAIYSAQWVPVNNSIIVTGTPEAVMKVVELLEELDKEPKQVYIEVLIIDTTLENSLDFGVQWIALGNEQNTLAFASGLLNNGPPNLQGGTLLNGQPSPGGARFVAANPAASPPSIPNPGRDVALPIPANLGATSFLDSQDNSLAAFGLGFVGNIIRHNGQSFLTLGALVSALDAEVDSVIVTNPKVMVEDNQPADFFVGQNIPYQTTSTVIQQTGSVTQNIQYEDVGMQLRVVPTIAPNDVVTLQIDQSIVDVTNLITNGLIAPITRKTLLTTRVHVPSGTFLVMSGQVRDTSACIRSGVPCLGTLPLIGPAFSRTLDAREKRNLIFFIRPTIVHDIFEGLKITNQEGFDYNWESHPCTLIECVPERAPENESYPPPACPDH